MVSDDAALVLVRPTDDIPTIIANVRQAQSSAVQLLVPDGVRTLHDSASFAQIAQGIDRTTTRLLVIAADEPTLNAAAAQGFETVGVYGTQVLVPLSADELAAPAPPADPALSQLSAHDADFLDALDSLDMDDTPADDDPFAELDSLSDAFAQERSPAAARQAAPARRVRPEDIELSADEQRRAAAVKPVERAPRRPREERERDSSLGAMRAEQAAQDAPQKGFLGLSPLAGILAAVLLILLLASALVLGFTWLSGPHAVIVLEPPLPPADSLPIVAQPIFITQAGAAETTSAVRADPIRATVLVTQTGLVTDEVLSPAGAARGVVVLYNQNTQAIDLPLETEFVAVNPAGQNVSFTIDGPAALPGSATRREGAQIITTLGQAQVTVTARTPGSAGNVDANTMREMIIPGQAPIALNGGTVLAEHGPIAGGDEQPIRVVKDADVRAVLEPVLNSLNNRARQQLEQQAAADGLMLEVSTINPDVADLSEGTGYELLVVPPVGETVDPANPQFVVSAEGVFGALATPPGSSLQEQLQPVLAQQLVSDEMLPHGMAPAISAWSWDGERLTVDGVLQPTGEALPVDSETRLRIRNALRGQPRAAAEQALQQFVDEGVISSYRLPPDLESVPSRDSAFDLRVESPASSEEPAE